MAKKAEKKEVLQSGPVKLWDILDAAAENPKRGIPTLVGPSGYGKTHEVTRWAEARGRKMVVVRPGIETEEDFGGHPIRDSKKNEVRYSNPAFLTTALRRIGVTLDEPLVLFVDELDKGRAEVLTCMLSLFNPDERCIRETVLGTNVMICAAMNEPEIDLPEPLAARLLLVPYPYDWAEYLRNAKQSVIGLRRVLQPNGPEVRLPKRPSSPRSDYQLEQWFSYPDFWENESLRRVVVRGLYSQVEAPAVLEYLATETPVVDGVAWINKATPAGIVHNLIRIIRSSKPADREAILRAFLARAEADPTGDLMLAYAAFTSPEDPRPHASCIAGEHTYEGRPVQEIGQEVFEKNFALLQEGKEIAKI